MISKNLFTLNAMYSVEKAFFYLIVQLYLETEPQNNKKSLIHNKRM